MSPNVDNYRTPSSTVWADLRFYCHSRSTSAGCPITILNWHLKYITFGIVHMHVIQWDQMVHGTSWLCCLLIQWHYKIGSLYSTYFFSMRTSRNIYQSIYNATVLVGHHLPVHGAVLPQGIRLTFTPPTFNWVVFTIAESIFVLHGKTTLAAMACSSSVAKDPKHCSDLFS